MSNTDKNDEGLASDMTPLEMVMRVQRLALERERKRPKARKALADVEAKLRRKKPITEAETDAIIESDEPSGDIRQLMDAHGLSRQEAEDWAEET